MSGITEQEARERERKAYRNGLLRNTTWTGPGAPDTSWADRMAARAYPDPVTYGPVITTPGDAGQELRRRADGQWETRKYGGWTVSPYIADTYVLALASCVPVTDAEVEAFRVSYDNAPLGLDIRAAIARALAAARAAMRPEGTR